MARPIHEMPDAEGFEVQDTVPQPSMVEVFSEGFGDHASLTVGGKTITLDQGTWDDLVMAIQKSLPSLDLKTKITCQNFLKKVQGGKP